MAKLIFGLQQSLDGYIDHLAMRPGAALFRHFVEHVRDLAGCVYGRRTYEIMRYWDEDRPEWDAGELDFAAAWRSQPKWVVSRSLSSQREPSDGRSRGLVRMNSLRLSRILKSTKCLRRSSVLCRRSQS